MKPAISVVMPVYNRESFVGPAVESILNQTFSDFEFIILDDHSLDATVERIKSFQDERIRLIENHEKKNIPMLRNQGLQAARGDYIAIMDSDDMALPERLATEKRFLDTHLEYGLVGSDIYNVNSSGEHQVREYPKENDLIQYFTAYRCCFCNPTVMLRKSVLTQHRILHRENYIVASDYALQVDLLPYTKFENLSEICLTYRFHENNITHQTIRDPEKSAAREKIIDAIHLQVLKNLGISLTPEETRLYLAYTGESKKVLPDYECFDNFKRLLVKLKKEYGSIFGSANMDLVHEKALERIERNYMRQRHMEGSGHDN